MPESKNRRRGGVDERDFVLTPLVSQQLFFSLFYQCIGEADISRLCLLCLFSCNKFRNQFCFAHVGRKLASLSVSCNVFSRSASYVRNNNFLRPGRRKITGGNTLQGGNV